MGFEKCVFGFKNPYLVFTNHICLFAPYLGLCAKWVHEAIDFCISKGLLPVRFETEEEKYDFTQPFTVTVWGYYCSKMYGKPSLRADTTQAVLKYLHSQPSLVVKAWRKRLYRFSSATFFGAVSDKLKLWIECEDIVDDEEGDARAKKQRQRGFVLRKLRNEDGLFQTLGDTLFRFMRMKATPFPNAFLSKPDFLKVPGWQRAIIFVHLYRYVMNKPANKQWHQYGHENYRLNQVLFKRYTAVDSEVYSASTHFQNLPDVSPLALRKKRRIDTEDTDSSQPSFNSPAKHLISLESSSEED